MDKVGIFEPSGVFLLLLKLYTASLRGHHEKSRSKTEALIVIGLKNQMLVSSTHFRYLDFTLHKHFPGTEKQLAFSSKAPNYNPKE